MTRIVLALTTIIATLLGVLVAPASAEIRTNVMIQNQYTRKCLDVGGWSTNNFAEVVQWDCHGETKQLWSFNTQTGLIVNTHSRKCLEIIGYGTHNGAQAVQYDCHGGRNQQWDINRASGLLVNRNSQKFLHVLGNSTANYALTGQWDYMTAGPSVYWWIG